MNLLKFSLVVSFSGILTLLFLSSHIQPEKVSDYSDLKLGSYVTTTSRIMSVKSYDNFKIIRLNNNITLTCNNCNLKEEKLLTVKGRVIKYKNMLEISADEIENE